MYILFVNGVTIADIRQGFHIGKHLGCGFSGDAKVHRPAPQVSGVLSLPASFFGAYQTGELSTRVEAVRTIASSLQSMVLSTGLTSVF